MVNRPTPIRVFYEEQNKPKKFSTNLNQRLTLLVYVLDIKTISPLKFVVSFDFELETSW